MELEFRRINRLPLQLNLWRRRNMCAVRLLSGGETLGALTVHRNGGISIPEIPKSGGTTICWGDVRRRCERTDAEQLPVEKPVQLSPDLHIQETTVKVFGPFMLRIGRNF